MGKWGKYTKKFQRKWLQEPAFKNWLEESDEKDVANGKSGAFCKLCKAHLRPHHSDLISHSKCAKHIAKEAALNRSHQPSLKDHGYSHTTISDEAKSNDIQLALYIAMHTPIKAVDHLGDLLKVISKGSQLENLRLHRTKCSKLITAVIAPALVTALVRDIGDSPYSIIADESTDVSVTKFMGLCVRYHSKKENEMVTDFLGIVEVTKCTGEILAASLLKYLEKIGLLPKNLTSIGTDGASNMSGKNNSFYTHLKQQIPDLLLIKCICHSLDKCAQYAFKKLPDHLDYLLRETSNWFSHSALRRSEYVEYFKTLNNGKVPAKMQRLCTTRWMTWLPVSTVILDQWTELKEFFKIRASSDFKAVTLARLFDDQCNLLYLIFLKSILLEVQAVNLSFQQNNADVTKIYSDLRTLVFSLCTRVLKPEAIACTERPGVSRSAEIHMLREALNSKSNLKPLDRVQFGESFRKLISSTDISTDNLIGVQMRCADYIMSLCTQLFERLPNNIDVIEKVKTFTPHLALSTSKTSRPQFDQLPLELAGNKADVDKLENEWRSLGNMTLPSICPHPDKNGDIVTIDAIHFWSCVSSLRSAGGHYPYKELARLALKCLTLPISNAVVERIFSFMAAIKTKERNRMQLQMLEALLRVRVHFTVNGACCRKLIVNKDMLSLFNASMYRAYHDNADNTSGSTVEISSEKEDIEDEDYLALNSLLTNEREDEVFISIPDLIV